jgi:hypothetical protein
MGRFEQTITGGSQNTGRAVVRIGAGAVATERVSLSLPTNWTADDEGRKLLNERLRQIEYELSRPKDYEVNVPVHYAYADWDDKFGGPWIGPGPAPEYEGHTPVPGAKLMLDKLGTWLLLMQITWLSWTPDEDLSAYLAVDPEDEDEAKIQAAFTNSNSTNIQPHTDTSWSIFTTTSIPRLVQLYARDSYIGEGPNSMLYYPSHIAAIWLSAWTASTRRFGRQTPSLTTSILDPYGDLLTIYGEEARWPKSEHPDTLPIGADFLSL